MWASLKMVNREVILHFLFIQFMMIILNILGDVSYTDVQGDVLGVAKVLAFRDAF